MMRSNQVRCTPLATSPKDRPRRWLDPDGVSLSGMGWDGAMTESGGGAAAPQAIPGKGPKKPTIRAILPSGESSQKSIPSIATVPSASSRRQPKRNLP